MRPLPGGHTITGGGRVPSVGVQRVHDEEPTILHGQPTAVEVPEDCGAHPVSGGLAQGPIPRRQGQTKPASAEGG